MHACLGALVLHHPRQGRPSRLQMYLCDVVPERTPRHAYRYRHRVAAVSRFYIEESTDAVEEEDWDCVCVLIWTVVCHVLDCSQYYLWEEEAGLYLYVLILPLLTSPAQRDRTDAIQINHTTSTSGTCLTLPAPASSHPSPRTTLYSTPSTDASTASPLPSGTSPQRTPYPGAPNEAPPISARTPPTR